MEYVFLRIVLLNLYSLFFGIKYMLLMGRWFCCLIVLLINCKKMELLEKIGFIEKLDCEVYFEKLLRVIFI